MEWKHLPVAGGIYDQHPDFVEGMMMLMEERGRHQEEEAKRKEAESKRNQTKTGLKGRRR
jgi:hypothetical protein